MSQSISFQPATLISLSFSLLLAFSFSVLNSQISIDRVSPPHWWTGFENDTLELIIKGKYVAACDSRLSYEGVELINSERLQSDDYLFLTLLVSENAQPGTIKIEFLKKGEKRALAEVPYELRERTLLGLRPEKGIEAHDLMYLIMPDRFANGDATNDVNKSMNEIELDRGHMYKRHGGDIQGIIDRLDYLQDLGASTLWLNPVLENDEHKTSYHGYACTDGYEIDPRFGTNDLYKSLVDSLHARDMKIVMDVVYNHWGDQHWLILDPPDSSWVNHWPSFTKTNYRSTTHMDPYASEWDKRIMTDGWFDGHMPDLNQRSPKLARHLIQQTKWWIEEWGIDALRIDTYAYPDQHFMASLSREMLMEWPDVFLFGETWVHGVPVQQWFTSQGVGAKEFDSELQSVTDFQLYFAMKKGLNEPFGWTEGASKIYYALAKDWVYKDPMKLVTFVDNHDLSRFYSEIKEDPKLYHMGIALILTTRGIPCLYYGTEIRMKNFADPDGKVRPDFPGGWQGDAVDKFNHTGRTEAENETFWFIQNLANFRRQNPDVFDGKLMQFVPEDGLYVYFRYTDQKCLMVCMNMSSKEQTVEFERYQERMLGFGESRNIQTGKQTSLNEPFSLQPKETLILELIN
jgi:neopullulanase